MTKLYWKAKPKCEHCVGYMESVVKYDAYYNYCMQCGNPFTLYAYIQACTTTRELNELIRMMMYEEQQKYKHHIINKHKELREKHETNP